ncbi:hypothetical protein [Litchfieldia salsa]|uniref:Uncharacterized protein n=1 Tax=Litchfieldia salsa TaxID=930152 RepID=A0A1H0RRP6_9BACI|nr:hypothetical protein [Litchfieldia salsa]SDP31658.1 hypothetical protein SAMN05216565_102334 [Litchfieldia salsa]
MVQKNNKQYQMPDALKEKKDYAYRVGYEATTGNETSPVDNNAAKTTKNQG